MIRTRAALARGLGGLGLLLALSAPLPAGEAELTYVRRLAPPIVGDRIGFPEGMTIDGVSGEVFVCDNRKNRILIFDAEGRFSFVISGGGSFSSPGDVAIDPDGRLVVLANHRRKRAVIELDFDGLFLREIEPRGFPEEVDPPNFDSLAMSPAGDRLYFVDTTNLMLWVTDREGLVLRGVDLAGSDEEIVRRNLILGNVDVYGDRVLVTIASDGEIRLFDLEGNLVTRVGQHGTAPCQVAFPTAAALDEQGNLVVIDQQRMIILRWHVGDNRCLGEHYSIGNAPGYLYFPNDIALAPSGMLFVSQGWEGRVQAYRGMPAAARSERVEDDTRDPDELEGEVRAAVEAWVGAWSDGRLEPFLDAYSADYRPWGVGDRATWNQLRRVQLERDAPVQIGLGEIEISPAAGNLVRAEFVLDLRTSRYAERMRKSLLLVRESRAWKIIEESAESLP